MKIRDGQIDVAIVAGPRLHTWPTQGVRVLSRYCSDAGLKVGWYGGPGVKVRGVLPLEPSGAVVMVEDVQKRLHRIKAKSVVKVVPEMGFPLPFEGWYSPGLIPESTAIKLIEQGSLSWQPVVAILGTGNRALRLGSRLLESKLSTRVVCVESIFDTVQGFEVEKRRFEMAGGKVIYGKPIKLSQKSATQWELKVQDDHGTRVIDSSRVISVGPFTNDPGFREYPSGSLMVEWDNTESIVLAEDVERITADEHRAVILSSRIIRGLQDVGSEYKAQLDRALWASKQKLKEIEKLAEKRFRWTYDGKWLSAESKTKLQEHGGTLKLPRADKILASIECVESIVCRACEKSCPAGAISIDREKNQFLLEDKCTGCGFCLKSCPSKVPVMIEGDSTQSFTTLVVPYFEKPPLKKGERVGLLSRKGEVLAQGRVLDQFLDGDIELFKIEVPSHLIWEVRGVVSLAPKTDTQNSDDFYQERGNRVEVQIQGDVRRVREGQLVSVALFEIGMARPNDILVCEDGSCGLCTIEVDGLKKHACETTIHQGMSLRFTRDHAPSSQLCPCEEVSTEDMRSQTASLKPDTIEALSQVSPVTQGRCHGMLCKKSWMQEAENAGIKVSRYVDWRFPWMDWSVK